MYKYDPLNGEILRSADINKHFKLIQNDIIELYNRTNYLENKQWETNVIANATIDSISKTTQSFVDELDGYIDAQVSEYGINNILISLYENKDIIYPTEKESYVIHDSYYGRAILPHISSDSLFMTKSSIDDTVKMLDNINDFVQLKSFKAMEDSELVEQKMTDIKYAFDIDDNSYFIRNVKTKNAALGYSDLTVEITIPSGTFNINELKINPFPENGITIDKISYIEESGKESFFKDNNGNDLFSEPVIDTRKIGTSVLPTTITSMKIVLHQNNAKLIDDIYHYYLGLNNISITNKIYNSIGYIGFKLKKVDGEDITGIQSIATNLSALTPELHQLIIYDDMENFNNNNIDNSLYDSNVTGFELSQDLIIPEAKQELYLLVKLIKPEIEQYTPELKTIQINLI